MSTLYSSGKVTAYGAAVDAGYTGTYAQFSQAQADLPTEIAILQAMSATASTLAAGSDATASYDHSTGVLSIGVPTGATGATGATFTPSVSQSGVISWTNDGGAQNPQSVDLVAAVLSALPYAVGANF